MIIYEGICSIYEKYSVKSSRYSTYHDSLEYMMIPKHYHIFMGRVLTLLSPEVNYQLFRRKRVVGVLPPPFFSCHRFEVNNLTTSGEKGGYLEKN